MKITKSTKIFITGCGGMLGKAAYTILNQKATVLATDIDLNEKFLKFCDIRNFEESKKIIKKFRPDIIYHLGALTDLEYCENHPEEAWATNALGTENMVNIANELDIPLLYISTAGIFDGKQDEYVDYDFPNPLNVYGKSKYAGELLVQKRVKKHFVFRAGWMMGGGPAKDKKFVSKIMKQINNGAKDLYVVDDKLGTPTYTFDFIRNTIPVVEKNLYGIYNLVCSNSGSRYDVAKELLLILKNNSIKLHKVDSTRFKKEYFADRPFSEKLLSFKLKNLGLYTMRDWKVCLKEYLKEWK